MDIRLEKSADGAALTVFVSGSVDTVTAPRLDEELNKNYDGLKELTLDFEQVDYVSSAGLRVIMSADQRMGETGKLILRNVNSDVREVLEMTGFGDFLTIV